MKKIQIKCTTKIEPAHLSKMDKNGHLLILSKKNNLKGVYHLFYNHKIKQKKTKMLIKKLVPFQLLNHTATVMLVSMTYSLYPYTTEKRGIINFTSAKIGIAFYDENQNQIVRPGDWTINDLPVSTSISTEEYSSSSPATKEMVDIQQHYIFEEIKNKYGLIYFDDTFEIDDKLVFCKQEYPTGEYCTRFIDKPQLTGYYWNYKEKIMHENNL